MMNRIFTHLFKGEDIRKQANKNNEILRGARAMNAQLSMGLLERETNDYDLFSKRPLKSALELEKELDRKAGGDFHYVKPAIHPGTWKVMDRGNDLQSPHDDFVIADYTKQPKKVRTVMVGNTRMVHQSMRIADAKKTLKNPMAEHRWAKDRGDLDRIKASKMFRMR